MSTISELLTKLKSFITEVDDKLQETSLPKDFLISTRKTTNTAVKELGDKRKRELLEAEGTARELLPQIKEVISEQARQGEHQVMWDVPSKYPVMTWQGYFLGSFPTRDDVGNALVNLLKAEGFEVSGRWIVQECGAGYTHEFYRLWANW